MKYPEVMDKSNDEILLRMIFLRETLPGCNIARMVSLAPRSVFPMCRHIHLKRVKNEELAEKDCFV